jgi:hypothetical protein
VGSTLTGRRNWRPREAVQVSYRPDAPMGIERNRDGERPGETRRATRRFTPSAPADGHETRRQRAGATVLRGARGDQSRAARITVDGCVCSMRSVSLSTVSM